MAPPLMAAITLGSTALQAGGQIAAGNNARKDANYQAGILQQDANAARATGTYQAYETRRQGRVAMSDARAAMAGSGGVTTDPGATDILGNISNTYGYNALMALYNANAKARGLDAASLAKRYEGKLAQRASRIKALGTAISGGTSAYGIWKGV